MSTDPVTLVPGRLDKTILQERLGRWLTGRQIDTMLKRRDKILELAERLVAEKGEDKVLY